VVINTGHVNLAAATESIVKLAEAKLGHPFAPPPATQDTEP
jgi:hypothetical protein